MKTTYALVLLSLATIGPPVIAQTEVGKRGTPTVVVSTPSAIGPRTLHFNFREAPLETVLAYMSQAGGFIINLEADVKGKVDVWSSQPLSRDEACEVLNTILKKSGLAALRNDRTLTIVSRDEAHKRDIPVKKGNVAAEIPKTDAMVTQIIGVKHVNATQLVNNLVQLLPSYATMTANESANTLVLTATQTDVRRITEIINALDFAISSMSIVRVFPIRYGDAKELANVIKELFQPSQQQVANQGGQEFNVSGGGGISPESGTFPGSSSRGAAGDGVRTAIVPVVAIADERSNSLVVSASEDIMRATEKLIKEIDQSVSDITELRVFHLKHADPAELADKLSELFPDDTNAGNTSNQPIRFGGGSGPSNNTPSPSSERMKKKGQVVSVADTRTASIIVSAASELMPQIARLIDSLDSNSAKKQRVFIYALQSGNVRNITQILNGMFQSQNSRNTQNSSSQSDALMNRMNQQPTRGTSTSVGGNSSQSGSGGSGGSVR